MQVVYSIRSKKNGLFIESPEIVVTPFTGGAYINDVSFPIPYELLHGLTSSAQYDKGISLVNGIIEFVDSFSDEIYEIIRHDKCFNTDCIFKAKLDFDQLVEGLVKDGKL